MNRDTLAAIDAAARSAVSSYRNVPAEIRFDLRQELRQELALKIAEGRLTIEGLGSAAHNWLLSEFRNYRNRCEIEAEYESGVQKRYKDDDNWIPSWYPPSKDAEEHAPFAMRDARVMHVKSSQTFRDVHGAMVECLSS